MMEGGGVAASKCPAFKMAALLWLKCRRHQQATRTSRCSECSRFTWRAADGLQASD